mmetsp:Transcript_4631/g.11619  ORF Transcript_4631/g.11619 Transcript_4631/m.11619 type:complete len:292 (+) Transcript_4631:104-979(+)
MQRLCSIFDRRVPGRLARELGDDLLSGEPAPVESTLAIRRRACVREPDPDVAPAASLVRPHGHDRTVFPALLLHIGVDVVEKFRVGRQIHLGGVEHAMKDDNVGRHVQRRILGRHADLRHPHAAAHASHAAAHACHATHRRQRPWASHGHAAADGTHRAACRGHHRWRSADGIPLQLLHQREAIVCILQHTATLGSRTILPGVLVQLRLAAAYCKRPGGAARLSPKLHVARGDADLELFARKLEAVHGRHRFARLRSILELHERKSLALVGVRIPVQIDKFDLAEGGKKAS